MRYAGFTQYSINPEIKPPALGPLKKEGQTITKTQRASKKKTSEDMAQASGNSGSGEMETKPKSKAKVADFVFIVGYGRVGQLICEMLDRRLVPYVVVESSPQRAIDARNKGLPVYFGTLHIL